MPATVCTLLWFCGIAAVADNPAKSLVAHVTLLLNYYYILDLQFIHTCSATAATNYPSLRDSPNGCQGHLRPCLSPPDRPLVTEPDSNDVRTRSTFIQLLE
jgi:hypothetical protein